MPDIQIPYGKSSLTLSLPADRDVSVIAPVEVPAVPDAAQAVGDALDHMVGRLRWQDFAGIEPIAIVISDKTRPIPQAALYPLLARLTRLGIRDEAITFLIATGTHTPMTPDEFGMVLPAELLARYRVLSHDCDDRANLVYKGATTRGTPVWVNRHFDAAGLRIVVGNLEPHQFMGFSGGVKSAAIGMGGRETINTNHAMLRDPAATLGAYDANPMRQDVEEIGRMMGVHVALNTILNRDKQIVRAIAGEPLAVMQAGIPLVRELVAVPVDAPFDLTITAPGGHPKDINLYQAQKALGHATPVTRDGGTVILVAACPEGTGSASYEAWMEDMTSFEAVLERFSREEFRLGPHKAFQIARDASRVRTLVVSDMPHELVRRLLLTPVASLDEALAQVLPTLPPGARIGVLPRANATVPLLTPESLSS